jgi:hypothetical protein
VSSTLFFKYGVYYDAKLSKFSSIHYYVMKMDSATTVQGGDESDKRRDDGPR